MVSTESQARRARKGRTAALEAPAYKVRIEAVDNWHQEWAAVFTAIRRSGQESSLMLDKDGWLSARQTVFAAFGGRRVVAYLCFHVAPMKSAAGTVVVEEGRALLEAQLDAIWIAPDAIGQGVERTLIGMAESHAIMLQCRTFRHDGSDVC